MSRATQLGTIETSSESKGRVSSYLPLLTDSKSSFLLAITLLAPYPAGELQPPHLLIPSHITPCMRNIHIWG